MAAQRTPRSAGPTERGSGPGVDTRAVARFWDRSLTEHVDPIEEAAADEPLTSRAALGLDIHEAKGLGQCLSVTTPRELWMSFARHARDGALDDFAAGLERSLFSSAKGGRVLQSIRLALIKRSLPPSLLCEVAQIIDLDSLEPSPPPAAGDVMSTAPDKMPTAAARKRQGEARFPQAGDSAPSGAGVDLSPCSESAVDCAEGPVADQAHESPGEDRPPQEEQEEQEFGTEGVSSGSEGEFRDSDDDAVAPSALSTASEDAEARMGPGPDPVPVDGAGSASETDDSSASVDALEARLSAESLAPQPAPESWHVKSPYAPETSSGEAPSREAAAVYTAACAAAEARPVRRFLSALVAQGAVHLESYLISGPSWQAVCNTLQHPVCPIQELHVAGNALGDAVLQLVPSLGSRSKLCVLDLSNNRIRPAVLHTVVQAAAAAPLLSRLVLRGNRVDDRAAQALARTLSDAPALRGLDLADNDIGDAGASALAGELCAEGRELRSLTLSWNRVGPGGAAALAETLKAHVPLQELDLGFNAVGEMGGVALMAALPFTSSLQRLSLAQNRCGPLTAFVASAALPMNEALEELSLAHNPVGSVARELLGALPETHPSLRRLGTEGASQCHTNPLAALDTGDTDLDMAHADGAYSLDLGHPWQRAVAELLRALATCGRGSWKKALWNKRPILVAPAAWGVPTVGTLEVVVETSSGAAASPPAVREEPPPSPPETASGESASQLWRLPEVHPRKPSGPTVPTTAPAPTGGASGEQEGLLPPLVKPKDLDSPRRPISRGQGKRGLTLPAVEEVVLKLHAFGPRLPGGPVSARVAETARRRERGGEEGEGDTREGASPPAETGEDTEEGSPVGPGSPRGLHGQARPPTPLWQRACSVCVPTHPRPSRERGAGLWKVDGLTRDQYQALLVRVCGVRFALDLGAHRDRRLARTIAARVGANPEEVVEEVQWRGEPLALYWDGSNRSPGGQLLDWLDQQGRGASGLLEFRLVTMALHHRASHCLRLSDPGQRRKACMLLQQVWSSRDDRMGGDLWANCRLDGASFRVATWLEKRDAGMPPEAPVDEIWRIPAAGVLEFDYVCRSPEHVSTDRYRLDLSRTQDSDFAQDLRMRCALNPGDCMWGAAVDGAPVDVASPEGMRHDLPRFGTLEFDFVVLRPPAVLSAMRHERILLDLGDAVVRHYATLLHRRVTRVGMRSRELWLHPCLNGRPMPSPTCSSGLWQGQLSFELAYYCPGEPVGTIQFDQLRQDLEGAASDGQRLRTLAAVGEEPSVTAFFLSGMVVDMVKTLGSLRARTQAVKHLLPRMLDAHNAFRMLQPLLRDATTPSEAASATQQRKALFVLLSGWTARGMVT